jgi:hypothetical protein
MAVPYTFGSATTSIPLSQLDSNFATTITLGNTAVQLGNTITTLTGVTNVASSGSLTLGTSGNTTAVTIDTSQNVGIGTSSPNIGGYGANSRILTVQGVSGSYAIAELSSNSANSDGTFVGRLDFSSSGQAANYVNVAAIASTLSGSTSTKFGSTLQFYTRADNAGSGSPSERMRIDSSGNLLVGTTSGSTHIIQKSNASSNMLQIINSSGTSPSGASFSFSAAAPNNGTQTFFTTGDTGGYRGGWLSNGGIQNYQGNNSNLSDQREKKNIQLAPNYLDKICQIPVKTFLFNDQTDTELNLGSIAQDVQAICPELITESNWGTEEEPKMRLSIYQTDLQYALMKSIQELKAINDQQAETINALTARIVALEAK